MQGILRKQNLFDPRPQKKPVTRSGEAKATAKGYRSAKFQVDLQGICTYNKSVLNLKVSPYAAFARARVISASWHNSRYKEAQGCLPGVRVFGEFQADFPLAGAYGTACCLAFAIK